MLSKELAKILLKYPKLPVHIVVKDYALGSEETGMYENGSHSARIIKVQLIDADPLTAYSELDEVDHIELWPEEE